jgi:hypothetical protein
MGPEEGGANEQSEADAPPPPEPDAFMAVVAHRDTSALWTSTGYDSRAKAENAALRGCRSHFAKGCYVAWWGYNDFTVVVARDSAGLLFTEGDINAGAATSKAVAACAEQSVGCQVIRTISNSNGRRDDFPATKVPIHKYAVIAWPKEIPADNWKRKYWLVSGVSGYEAAVDAAVSRCTTDTGMRCIKGQHSSAGIIARFVDDAGKTYWIDAANAEAADRRVTAHCPPSAACRIIEKYAADQPRTSILDEDRADQPHRGFYAAAWPSTATKSAKIALVTGQSSRENATRAALELCRVENRAPCEPALDDGDWGTEQFIAIAGDSKASTRIEFGYSAKQAEAKMAAACQHDKVECSMAQITDLAQTTRKLIAIPAVP